ncbi:MAG: FAD-dependent monooxygenase, partial [Bacteroidota bacterium]
MRINKDDSILIIGGGLSGLFTALALQHEGYESVKLLHKDQELNWPETPVQLGAHLFPLLTAFGLVDELKTLGTPWTQGGFKAKNGKEVQNLDLDRISNMVGFKPHLIPASALLKLIKDRLKPGTLQGKADF